VVGWIEKYLLCKSDGGIALQSHHHRKRFGQHFLHDEQVIGKIIASIAPAANQHLVEIGPGLGVLTQYLVPRVKLLDVIEIDRDLIPKLQDNCASLGNLRIHQADVLKFDFANIVSPGELVRVVGNLPYNISTPLLFHVLKYLDFIADMHFMLQREVAWRLAAQPNSKDYGRLSIMVQYYCQVERLFDVPPSAFQPPPEVNSSVVRLIPIRQPKVIANNLTVFSEVVRTAFTMRRKVISNCLKKLLTAADLERLGIDPKARPEQLSVEQFVEISNIIAN
jgi:16S rRNA (adenine1518-N6/adenine1519-N6)-dimethyltransferase